LFNCRDFYNLLDKNGIRFYCGVPDSLLKDFCAFIEANISPEKHIITANEGNAIALAAGVFLSTKNPGLVYMQNSGEGNALNPLVSLVDENVYSIPVLLLIGWRGEPNIKDEPQHIKQGKITLSLLDTLDIPYSILPENINDAEKIINKAFSTMMEKNRPYALIVKKGTFEQYKNNIIDSCIYELSREDTIKIIVDNMSKLDVCVSTTGMTSRELFEYRKFKNQDNASDFLTVGSMGHSSSIALGIALNKPERQVFCIDGDGAAIMHLGALTTIGTKAPENFKHIIINNGAHDSVGGQDTAGFKIDFCKIAQACGYNKTLVANNKNELEQSLNIIKDSKGPSLLEVRIKKGARKDLGRPTKSPIENKIEFMEFLGAKCKTNL